MPRVDRLPFPTIRQASPINDQVVNLRLNGLRKNNGGNMDWIPLAAVLLATYLAANLFVMYDNKRIEAECKFTRRSDRAD
jgi:hypothetical protein